MVKFIWCKSLGLHSEFKFQISSVHNHIELTLEGGDSFGNKAFPSWGIRSYEGIVVRLLKDLGFRQFD